MKNLILFCGLFLFFACTSKQGPAGPTGPQGKIGESNMAFYDTSGVLPTSIYWYDSSFKYWEIDLPSSINFDSCLIQTLVQMDMLHLLKEPTWYYFDLGTIRIIDDLETNPGYLYKINIIYYY